MEKEVRFDVGLLFFCADRYSLARNCSILGGAVVHLSVRFERDWNDVHTRGVKKIDIFRVI
ncbi:hypothetical protein [Thalassospira lucentensis]|uniref:hypothetical protein n=1 Tax=Thalassospira lucentensis TaxID=168935 RepID=UPI0011BDD728|nr:hypothetical protein [Thalassospira lucentensis]